MYRENAYPEFCGKAVDGGFDVGRSGGDIFTSGRCACKREGGIVQIRYL
jgi:hypothetical protein